MLSGSSRSGDRAPGAPEAAGGTLQTYPRCSLAIRVVAQPDNFNLISFVRLVSASHRIVVRPRPQSAPAYPSTREPVQPRPDPSKPDRQNAKFESIAHYVAELRGDFDESVRSLFCVEDDLRVVSKALGTRPTNCADTREKSQLP